jgi:hypothetical protein
MFRNIRLRTSIAAVLVAFTAACADAGTEDDAGTGTNDEPSILPPAEMTGGDTTADVGDFGTGTGDAQSGGDLTGEVPDSATVDPAP